MRGGSRFLTQGKYPVVQAIKPSGQWDLLPNGHRVLGVNIVDRVDFQSAGTKTHLADMWRDWEWSAAGAPGAAGNWIKPQIDAGKALGANTVRFFSTQYGRAGSGSGYATPINDATYFGRWDQLLSYLRSQGMYCYPCLCGDSDMQDSQWYGYTPTLSWLQTEYAQHARFFTKYADVIIGVDLSNETTNWPTTSGQGLAVYRAVKVEAPNLKFTWSADFHHAPNPGGNNVDGRHYPPSGTFDFLDAHFYYDAAVSDMDSTMSFYNMPAIIGEFGQNMAAGTTARQSRYNATKAVVNNVTSGRQVAGALAWNMYDQDTVSTNQWGIADASGNVRADVSALFSSFPS
jgi:hypothetical protein